ncbi:MAG TPA: GAF domain-containing protein [Mycobacterium sp.]|nr:GAF domain-containing protein [Mycobacterium sp.]HUH67731.1 GAF domain-containing protein [Mycobacterium sp.]
MTAEGSSDRPRDGDSAPRRAVRARLHPLLLRPIAPPLWLGVVVAAALLVGETALVLFLARMGMEPRNLFGAVFLLGVLVISAGWGFGLAVTMTLASAVVYLEVHLGTGGSLFPMTALDVVPVAVFLPIALLANVLVGQARLRAVEAEKRRREAIFAAEQVSELAEQQAALRRVATQIAQGVSPSAVFAAVADQVANALRVSNASLFRYGRDGSGTIVAAHDETGLKKMPVGARLTLEGDNVAGLVLRTGAPARMDSHQDAKGPAAALIRDLGLRTGVGAPIVVDGRLWGAAIVGSSRPEPLPSDTEARLADFAELVATAIANAEARTQLMASRARIVAAADDARRRIERDLHDGAQQRLVTLGLQVRSVEASVPSDLDGLKQDIADIGDGLVAAGEELREISHGIHPAILSKGGLRPALRTLGRRAAMPVEVNVRVERRLPESVEVAAYCVVAEALTNTAKHARASAATVSVDADDRWLRVAIQDDGIGGADVDGGSGLIGLKDRVEALGGVLQIQSPTGGGTKVIAEMPLAPE